MSSGSWAATTGTPQWVEWCPTTSTAGTLWRSDSGAGGGGRLEICGWKVRGIRLGPMATISADDGRVTQVFMLDGHNIFRYHFASNRWLKEATLRRKIPNTELCGFVSLNGELNVIRSANVPIKISHPRRLLKKGRALEFQVYNPVSRKWRVFITHAPVSESFDCRSAALCTVEL